MLGVLPQDLTLSHEDNLITLCYQCHFAYDTDFPPWLMVPTRTILNSYIRHERENYGQRQLAAAQGRVLPRTLPTINNAAVEYQRLVLDPAWAATRPINQALKTWGGDPATAIFKALGGLAQPCRPIVVDMGAQGVVHVEILEELRTKVMELVRAWSRPDPQVVPPTAAPAPGSDNQGDDGTGGRPRRGPFIRKRKQADEGRPPAKSVRLQQLPSVQQESLHQRILQWMDGVPAFSPDRVTIVGDNAYHTTRVIRGTNPTFNTI